MDPPTGHEPPTNRAEAKLGETHFGDPATFQAVLARHGIEHVTSLAAGPTTRELWKNTERAVLLQTGADPLTGDLPTGDPQPPGDSADDGSTRVEPGYAGETYVEGPHDPVRDLYADIITSATHIRSEHAPLTDPATGEVSVSLYTHRGPPFGGPRSEE